MARKRYLKNTRLQKTLESYRLDMKHLVSVKPKQFDIGMVANMITSTPPRKWNAAQAIVEATDEKKSLEQQLKSLKATKMLEASSDSLKKKLSNADDRKAYVDNDPDVQALEVDIINADANLVAAKLAYECLDDLFTAGKKIMDWLTKEELAQRAYDKYVTEGNRQR